MIKKNHDIFYALIVFLIAHKLKKKHNLILQEAVSLKSILRVACLLVALIEKNVYELFILTWVKKNQRL